MVYLQLCGRFKTCECTLDLKGKYIQQHKDRIVQLLMIYPGEQNHKDLTLIHLQAKIKKNIKLMWI